MTEEPTSGDRRDDEEIRRHEAHLVAQIYHLIEANERLEEQLDRLARVTEIADLFRHKKVTRDTFEMKAPEMVVPEHVQSAWRQVEMLLARIPEGTDGIDELKDTLGIIRSAGWSVDPDWMADLRVRLVAAEQAIAYLDEQSRELDLLRDEKNSIMDGVQRLEQTIEDLWKSLNEKTTHIQRVESQLTRIWNSLPYRVYKTVSAPLRRGGGKS